MKKSILAFVPVLMLSADTLPTARVKYPSKVFLPGIKYFSKEHTKVCHGNFTESDWHMVWLCHAESFRHMYYGPDKSRDPDAVMVEGRLSCIKPACQHAFDVALEKPLKQFLKKRLTKGQADGFGKLYPYLSDYHKELFFNAMVQYNQPRVVKHFIDQGIDVNVSLERDLLIASYTVAYDTPESENDNLYEPLKKGIIHIRAVKPIDAAREYGYTEIIKLLEDSGRLRE